MTIVVWLIAYESPEPYIAAACADALGSIGGIVAIEELKKAMTLGHSVIIRDVAEKSLYRWKDTN